MTLLPHQNVAAVLEAQEHTRPEIARGAGVSESTIARWRSDDQEYGAEIERLRKSSIADLKSHVKRVQLVLLNAVEKAIGTLVDNLEATTPEGNPLHGARHDAATVLLDKGVTLLMPKDSGGGDGAAASHASITVLIGEKKEPYIDGTVAE